MQLTKRLKQLFKKRSNNKELNVQYDEFQIDEKERDLKYLVRPSVPYGELLQALQNLGRQLENLQKNSEKERKELLIDVANEVFSLRRYAIEVREKMLAVGMERDFRGLDLVIKNMEDILRRQGISIEDPVGAPVNTDLLSKVDVLSWVHRPGVPGRRVAETEYPIIYLNGEVIKRGVVVLEAPSRE